MVLCQAWSCQETQNTLVSSGILITHNQTTHTYTHSASWERWHACRCHSKLTHPPVIPTVGDKRKETRGSGGGQAVAFLSMPLHPLISLPKNIPCCSSIQCPCPPLPILLIPSLHTSQHIAARRRPSTCCTFLWTKHTKTGQL